jgi:hypothetical protein
MANYNRRFRMKDAAIASIVAVRANEFKYGDYASGKQHT